MRRTTNHIGCVKRFFEEDSRLKSTLFQRNNPECWPVKIVEEREQRVADGNLKRDEPKGNPSSSSSCQWDGWWTSSRWDKSWQWNDKQIHDCFWPKVGVLLMIRQRRTPERRVEIPSARSALLFLHTTSPVQFTAICQSRLNHTRTLRRSLTPWFRGHSRHTPFAGYEHQYESMARKHPLVRNGQATRIRPGRISQEV